MTTQKFEPGDDVIVTGGDYKGRYGKIVEYTLGRYMVHLPELHAEGYWSVDPADLMHLTDLPEEEEEDEGPEVDKVYVPAFGMSSEDFATHLEYLLMRSLSRVATTGPAQAFYGYQEFEGKTPEEVLQLLLVKVEEGIALLSQTHVLVGRTIIALGKVK